MANLSFARIMYGTTEELRYNGGLHTASRPVAIALDGSAVLIPPPKPLIHLAFEKLFHLLRLFFAGGKE